MSSKSNPAPLTDYNKNGHLDGADMIRQLADDIRHPQKIPSQTRALLSAIDFRGLYEEYTKSLSIVGNHPQDAEKIFATAVTFRLKKFIKENQSRDKDYIKARENETRVAAHTAHLDDKAEDLVKARRSTYEFARDFVNKFHDVKIDGPDIAELMADYGRLSPAPTPAPKQKPKLQSI